MELSIVMLSHKIVLLCPSGPSCTNLVDFGIAQRLSAADAEPTTSIPQHNLIQKNLNLNAVSAFN